MSGSNLIKVICSSCRGQKKIRGAGYMQYPCTDCEGTGTLYIKENIDTQDASLQNKSIKITHKNVIAMDFNQSRHFQAPISNFSLPITRKRGRPPKVKEE